jgi:PKD repeat protein
MTQQLPSSTPSTASPARVRRADAPPGRWAAAARLTALTLVAGACSDAPLAPDAAAPVAPAATVATSAPADAIRIVTFGDSNTDAGYAGSGASPRVRAYISLAPLRLDPAAAHSPLQLAGKIERQWTELRPEALRAVNHGISATTTGGGGFGGASRTSTGAPNARTAVNGVTRFEAEVLGGGAPWNGGEPVNSYFPGGPLTRVNAYVPSSRSFAYVSMGTNDVLQSIAASQTVANLQWMIERWVAAGQEPRRFILTTLAPVNSSSLASRVPVLNGEIRALAARTGAHVIDLAAHVSADDGRTWRDASLHVGDALHYNESVREWLAQQVVWYVSSVVAAAPPAPGSPTAAAVVDRPAPAEGEVVTFDASGSRDPAGEPLTYRWTFGDGATATGVRVTHAYADNGSYTAVVTATDPGGLASRAATIVRPTNAPPVVNAGVDARHVAGRRFYTKGSFTDSGTRDGGWYYTVAWGDGTTSTGSDATPGSLTSRYHTYDAAGTYTVRVGVRDKDYAWGYDDLVVAVEPNQEPVASANGPYAASEGSYFYFSSTGTSDGNGDALTYRWTFGDGTTSTAASPRKRYADNGSYAVTLVVTDPSGAADTAATTATIANAAPTATLTAPSSISEGSGYTVSISGSDAGGADVASLEYALDCGLGAGYSAYSPTGKSVTCPVQRDQRAAVTVRGKVRDKDGAERAYSRSVSILNATPAVTLAATTATTLAPGGTLGVEGRFTDAGLGDAPWTYTVVWGDGTTSTTGSTSAQGGAIPAGHRYAAAGTYSAYMTVKDKDGKIGTSASVTVIVR